MLLLAAILPYAKHPPELRACAEYGLHEQLLPVRPVPSILQACLCASLLLQPVQCLRLPANLQAPDLAALAWIALSAPWLFAKGRAHALPLLGPFLLLLAASTLAAACSQDPGGSTMALLVEMWLYVWFASLSVALAAADDRTLKRALGCWLAAGVGNGVFILAQFARPDLQAATSAALGSLGSLDPFRPSGFFENCNSAAFFQLSALAPLAVLSTRASISLPCLVVLLLSLLATGSMGALSALAAAVLMALAALLALHRDASACLRLCLAGLACAAIATSLASAAVLADPEFADRVDYVLTGRSEGSAQSRMTLWSRAADLLQERFSPFGIGPDQFKSVAGFGVHNDALATVVERGLLGIAAAAILGIASLRAAVRVAARGAEGRHRPTIVPIAALAACAVLSMTHEVFHQRPLWLLLALAFALDQRRWPLTTCSTAATTCSTSASCMRE